MKRPRPSASRLFRPGEPLARPSRTKLECAAAQRTGIALAVAQVAPFNFNFRLNSKALSLLLRLGVTALLLTSEFSLLSEADAGYCITTRGAGPISSQQIRMDTSHPVDYETRFGVDKMLRRTRKGPGITGTAVTSGDATWKACDGNINEDDGECQMVRPDPNAHPGTANDSDAAP